MDLQDFLDGLTPAQREVWERIQVLKAEAKELHLDTQRLFDQIKAV